MSSRRAAGVPRRPIPTRVALFVDGQNLYYRCKDHYKWGWVHPRKLGEALVAEDIARYGSGSHELQCVHFYTGIHDLTRHPKWHGQMARRLAAYRSEGVEATSLPLRYDSDGKGREKGIDVRLAIDMIRCGRDREFDVAIVVTEDSDIDQAVQDLYALRAPDQWVAVENAQPHSGRTDIRNPRWLATAKRRRPITPAMFAAIRDPRLF